MTHADLSAAAWHKSSHSNNVDNCVEHAALASGQQAVRDTKDRARGAFVVGPQAWQSFADMAKTSTI